MGKTLKPNQMEVYTKKWWRAYKKAIIKHATNNGYKKGLKSFDDIYNGGTVNAFGYPDESIKRLTYGTDNFDDRIEIKSIEVNDYHGQISVPDQMQNEINKLPIIIEL